MVDMVDMVFSDDPLFGCVWGFTGTDHATMFRTG
jgi:hypothetical protein